MHKKEPATEQAAPIASTDSSPPASGPVLSSGSAPSLSIPAPTSLPWRTCPVRMHCPVSAPGPPSFHSQGSLQSRVAWSWSFLRRKSASLSTVLSATRGCFLTSLSWRCPGLYKRPVPESSPQLDEISPCPLPGEMYPWHKLGGGVMGFQANDLWASLRFEIVLVTIWDLPSFTGNWKPNPPPRRQFPLRRCILNDRLPVFSKHSLTILYC